MHRLLRPLCLLFGHDWFQPVPVRENKAFTIFRTRCDRCHLTIVGDWDWMETNRAWEHYR